MTAIAPYRKLVTALAGVAIMVVGTELGTDSKWYMYAVAVLTAVGVYATPNSTNA